MVILWEIHPHQTTRLGSGNVAQFYGSHMEERCAVVHTGTPDRFAEGEETVRVSRLIYAAIWTLICFGFDSSRGGSRTVSTPALYSALTLAASTDVLLSCA